MNIEIERFSDKWGPEKILQIYNPEVGVKGVLVIDNTTLGPGKGGIRMLPTISTKEVFYLARTMTWKCALAGLPFGGAKSGIIADPKKMAKEEKMNAIRAFSRALKPVCPRLYVAGPDMNTGEEEMAVFAAENGSMKACTGKPAKMCVKPGVKCGIPHEYGTTGFGVVQATSTVASTVGLKIEETTVAIDGFGNVGTFVAKYLTQLGAKLVAVSDSKGCIYNPKGLEFETLVKVKNESRSVKNYKPGRVLDNNEIFELQVDVLIPAALPNVITKDNVNRVKPKMLVEAANIPVEPQIEEVLRKRGVIVVPDIAANAGGVISSYAEYRGYNPKQMLKLVQRKIQKSIKAVLEHASERDLGLRDAAVSIAKKRIQQAK